MSNALSILYFAFSLAVVETARRRLGVPADITRKAFFVLAGAWSAPLVFLTPDPTARAAPFLILAAVTYASFRLELVAAIEDVGPGLGSVLFPLSCALLLRFFEPVPALCGIAAMALGDTSAALVGRRFGTRKYRVLGHARTMEGTFALFLVASISMALLLVFLGGVDTHRSVAFALFAGTVAASVEAASPYGSDNLTVPLAAGVTLSVLERLSQ
ncbi:MAG TPA: hypothetical protein VEK15_03915 [Vicinamibacteria bacterium]|nr:hypothetical protein [Vicinamibacteria bacterium]